MMQTPGREPLRIDDKIDLDEQLMALAASRQTLARRHRVVRSASASYNAIDAAGGDNDYEKLATML